MSSLTACVIPVGPDFQDPSPSTPNYPPYFIQIGNGGMDMFSGHTLTVSPTGTTFQVEVGDFNPGDTLSTHWVLDYPPYVDGTNFFASQDMKGDPGNQVALDRMFTATVTCSLLGTTTAITTLVAIVSDRGFADANTPSDRENRLNYDAEMPPKPVTLMAYWNLSSSKCQP